MANGNLIEQPIRRVQDHRYRIVVRRCSDLLQKAFLQDVTMPGRADRLKLGSAGLHENAGDAAGHAVRLILRPRTAQALAAYADLGQLHVKALN